MSNIDIEHMTKEEALEYMGLSSDANDFAIDEKFWQLSKKYRGQNTPESEQALNDLSAVYNIACGRRDEAKAKDEQRQAEKKYFGKTSDEWKNHFSYSWFKYLVILIVVLVAGSIIYNVLFKGRYDCSVVSFGHFTVDSEVLEDRFRTEKLKNPYSASVDIVVPNEQGQTENIYSNQTLAAVLSMYPDVLITDSMTYKYYFSDFADMSMVYDNIKIALPKSVIDHLEPVYLSEREGFLYSREYLLRQGYIDENTSVDEYSTEQIMIGLKITDAGVIQSLGIENLWPDSPAEIIIGIYSGTNDYSNTELMLIRLLQNMSFSD